MNSPALRRMILLAALIFALDQATKNLVLLFLGPSEEKIILPGFFKLVCWTNTGAAWSLFHEQNGRLAVLSALALLCLIVWRRHFHVQTLLGQLSLSLICGGILGNLFDRVDPARRQVIDFLRFYLFRRGGEEIGFPAFNVADSAICLGVGLLILLSFRPDAAAAPPASKNAGGGLKMEDQRPV
ncbi:MAG: signal peptidase II [Verrucomicrobiota bacterium]|jgi:signal peptidase II